MAAEFCPKHQKIIKNIFLTGRPACGKTTVLTKLISLSKSLKLSLSGFYTIEKKSNGRRIGFDIVTLNGQINTLAGIDIVSKYKVSKYGVNLDKLNAFLPYMFVPSNASLNVIQILDEIGKMECLSPQFIQCCEKILIQPHIVIGTISQKGGGFMESVRLRSDVEIIEVTSNNRNSLPDILIERILSLLD